MVDVPADGTPVRSYISCKRSQREGHSLPVISLGACARRLRSRQLMAALPGNAAAAGLMRAAALIRSAPGIRHPKTPPWPPETNRPSHADDLALLFESPYAFGLWGSPVRTGLVVDAFVARLTVRAKPASAAAIYHYLWAARFLPPCWPEDPAALDRIVAGTSLSVVSRHSLISHWRAFGRFAAKHFDLPNPMPEVQLPRLPRLLRRTFGPADFTTLWRATTDDRERALVVLLWGTGIRRGEIPLRRDQVRADAIAVSGKTGERLVAITPEVFDWLGRIGDLTHIWLWRRPPHRPMRLSGVWEMWRALVRRAGLTGAKLGPHTVRHTVATALLEAGADLREVQEQLGHKDLRSTQLYTHLVIERQVQVLRRRSPLAGLLRDASKGGPE